MKVVRIAALKAVFLPYGHAENVALYSVLSVYLKTIAARSAINAIFSNQAMYLSKVFQSRRHTLFFCGLISCVFISVFLLRFYPQRLSGEENVNVGPIILIPGETINLLIKSSLVKKITISVSGSDWQQVVYESNILPPSEVTYKSKMITSTYKGKSHFEVKTSTSIPDESYSFSTHLPLNLYKQMDIPIRVSCLIYSPKPGGEIGRSGLTTVKELFWVENEQVFDVILYGRSIIEKWGLWLLLLFISVVAEGLFILTAIKQRPSVFKVIILSHLIGLIGGIFASGFISNFTSVLSPSWALCLLPFYLISCRSYLNIQAEMHEKYIRVH